MLSALKPVSKGKLCLCLNGFAQSARNLNIQPRLPWDFVAYCHYYKSLVISSVDDFFTLTDTCQAINTLGQYNLALKLYLLTWRGINTPQVEIMLVIVTFMLG